MTNDDTMTTTTIEDLKRHGNTLFQKVRPYTHPNRSKKSINVCNMSNYMYIKNVHKNDLETFSSSFFVFRVKQRML